MIPLIDRLNNERHKLSGLGSLLLVFVVFTMAQSLQRPAELVAREAIELTTTLIEPLIKQTQAIPPEPKAVAQPKTATPSVAPAPSEPIKDRSPVDAVKPAPAPAAPAAPAPLPPPRHKLYPRPLSTRSQRGAGSGSAKALAPTSARITQS